MHNVPDENLTYSQLCLKCYLTFLLPEKIAVFRVHPVDTSQSKAVDTEYHRSFELFI